MTIISIKPGTGAEFKRIELSDGSLFSFKTCYLASPLMCQFDSGREISADEEAAFRFASACLRAEQTVLRLVARAEQTRAGLTAKLEKKGHAAAPVKAAISRLADLGVIDDSRFASLWIEARLARRTDSPRRLLAGLCGRGIGRSAAEAALRAVLDCGAERDLLGRYITKYFSTPAPDTAYGGVSGEKNKAALKFTLKREGFSPAVIEQCMEEGVF
jgi:regulatory protein